MKNENAFNWDINKTPIYDAQGNIINGYNQITRDDNGANIAVMKKTYNPMTTQQFSDTAHAVADRVGGTIQEFKDWDKSSTDVNIGAARPVITAQMEISDPLQIAGSKIEGTLTLGVGFDGSRSFFIGHTNTYLRCTNQFSSIVNDFTSRLTKNNMVRVEDIISNIGLYKDYERKLYENFKRFENVKIDEKIINECVARLVGLTKEERAMSVKERQEALSSQKLNKMDDIMASMRMETADLGSNAWALFNGVTHYTTHVMSNRGSSQELNTMFGAKSKANQIAYKMCEELLEA